AQENGAETYDGGLIVLAVSLVLMPMLALAKLWTAARANLAALAAEAKETVACSCLSVTAISGLLATALLGWWWLGAVAALALVPWLVREGLEGVRPCFCRPCLGGLRACGSDSCAPALCLALPGGARCRGPRPAAPPAPT